MNIEEMIKDIDLIAERFIEKEETSDTEDEKIEKDGEEDIEGGEAEESDPVEIISDIIEDLQKLLNYFEKKSGKVPMEKEEGGAPKTPGEAFSQEKGKEVEVKN